MGKARGTASASGRRGTRVNPAVSAGQAADLSVAQARALHLAAQGLLHRFKDKARKSDVLAAIERMRLLQIDTIHVVARSPYLVLFSRLGQYKPEWLDQLLAAGEILECWAHEACFAPIAAYAYHARFNAALSSHWSQKSARRMTAAHGIEMRSLLKRIAEHGAVRSADLDGPQRGEGGWWGWKPEKRWLEALFARGELMIARREKFQRVYDVRERVLARGPHAGKHPQVPPSDREVLQRFALATVHALGIAKAAWIADYFRTGRRMRDAELDAWVARGELLRVSVAGWREPAYVHPDHAPLLAQASKGELKATHTTVLSPFDPVVWDRTRASQLFGFDYRIECYTPEHKRQHGYFVLPILHRGQLVGRLDAKAHREHGRFELRAFFLEETVAPRPTLMKAIARAIHRCARWHGTPDVIVGPRVRKTYAGPLRAALRAVR
jgi:hypothetical protein